MRRRNLEDFLKDDENMRDFDKEFFHFQDKLYPWSTVYRFLFLADFKNKRQFMLGAGQKNVKDYWLNGDRTEFIKNRNEHKMGITYWLGKENFIHRTLNDYVNVEQGMRSQAFSLAKEEKGYRLTLPDEGIDVHLNDEYASTDFTRFKMGFTPFYRHNKYLRFKGKFGGEKINDGIAFIQKVYLNMPFIPWRWGRVFFKSGAMLDFFEPQIRIPLYKSLNFTHHNDKIEFKIKTRITFEKGLWTLSGETTSGEILQASIRSYGEIEQIFETPRTRFNYFEMPSRLEELTIKRKGRDLYSLDDLGSSVANCERAFYSRIGVRNKRPRGNTV